MRFLTSNPSVATALTTLAVVAACGRSDPRGPAATGALSGVVSATTGPALGGATVSICGATSTAGADGRFEFQDLPVGSATVVASAAGFAPRP